VSQVNRLARINAIKKTIKSKGFTNVLELLKHKDVKANSAIITQLRKQKYLDKNENDVFIWVKKGNITKEDADAVYDAISSKVRSNYVPKFDKAKSNGNVQEGLLREILAELKELRTVPTRLHLLETTILSLKEG